MSCSQLRPELADTASWVLSIGLDNNLVRFENCTFQKAIQQAKDEAGSRLSTLLSKPSKHASWMDYYTGEIHWEMVLLQDSYVQGGTTTSSCNSLTTEELAKRYHEDARSFAEMRHNKGAVPNPSTSNQTWPFPRKFQARGITRCTMLARSHPPHPPPKPMHPLRRACLNTWLRLRRKEPYMGAVEPLDGPRYVFRVSHDITV